MPLLLPAMLLRQDVRPVPHVERTDALGALELVAADRDEVDTEFAQSQVEVPMILTNVPGRTPAPMAA